MFERYQRLAGLLAACVAACVCTTSARATMIGTDNASAAAYAGGWTDGSDGSITGPGAFGSWLLFGTPTGYQIASAAGVGSAASGIAIDSSGVSFRLFEPNAYVDGYRFLSDDTNGLAPGYTFSLQMAVNFRSGSKGIDLRSNAGGDPTVFTFATGGDDYVVSAAATGNGSIGNAYSNNTVFTLTFTQVDSSGGTWTIDRTGGVTSSANGTYSGIARSIKLFNSSLGSGLPEQALFVNNLAIVPEPSSYVLVIGACCAMTWAGRRRLVAAVA